MIDRSRPTRNYLSRIRGIPLLPEERVARVFSLQDGLLDEPTSTGRLLVATNHRILFFSNNRGYDEASLLPVEELKGVVVDSLWKGSYAWMKGILTLVGVLLFYLLVSYWFVVRIDSPNLPGLNMDLLPFVILVTALVAGWLFWQQDVRRPGGKVTLQGANWDLSFIYLGAERIPEVNTVVETLFICRQNRAVFLHTPPEPEVDPDDSP